MRVLILAAGYATRLYPITENRPKAILPINGKPIIQYIIDQINQLEKVTSIFVISNSKFYNDFKEWEKHVKSNIPVVIIDDGTTTEENKRGAIGDIQFTIEKENIDEDLMVIAGDNFFSYKLKDYYDYYLVHNKDSVVVKKHDDLKMIKSFAVAVLDRNNIIIDLEEKPDKPKSNIAVYACYIFKKETLSLFKKYLDEGNNKDAPGHFVAWLYKIKPVIAYKIDGECYDIGTKEIYDYVQSLAVKYFV